MLKVYNSIDAFDETRGTLFNWIYTIVRNAALDKIRLKQYPSTQDIGELEQLSFEQTPIMQLEAKEFYTMLDSLCEPSRFICNLFYVEGFSIKEISQTLSMQEGTVKWHLHVIRKKLKPVFEKYYE